MAIRDKSKSQLLSCSHLCEIAKCLSVTCENVVFWHMKCKKPDLVYVKSDLCPSDSSV